MKFTDIINTDFTPKWDVIENIYEFKRLSETQQSSIWHKEGNVYEHTKLVCSRMSDVINGKVSFIRNEELSDEQKTALMAAAVCHDLGKATSTKWDKELQEWKTKNHGAEGERITRLLFFDEPNIQLREKVCYMVRRHMVLHHIFDVEEKINSRMMSLMGEQASVYEMVCLNYADSLGSINDQNTPEEVMSRLNRVLALEFSINRTHEDLYENHYGFRRTLTDNSPNVYVMMGVAGSGKSTYAQRFLPNAMQLSRDVIREELGYAKEGEKVKCTKEQENNVTEVFNKKALNALAKGQNIVIDNMNLTKRYRDMFHREYDSFNPRYTYIYVEAPTINTNITRRDGQIPEKEIERMVNSIDFPEGHEYDSLRLVKQTELGGEIVATPFDVKTK